MERGSPAAPGSRAVTSVLRFVGTAMWRKQEAGSIQRSLWLEIIFYMLQEDRCEIGSHLMHIH